MSFLVGKLVLIKEMSCDDMYEAKILAVVKDAGQTYYKIKIGKIVEYLNTSGIERITIKRKEKKLKLVD